jgi:hypothetical protein
VNHLVTAYGFWAVALLVGAESIGVPLPGETILIVAAIYAGHTHRLSVWAISVAAAAAAIAGDNIGCWIGDKGGYRLLRRYGPASISTKPGSRSAGTSSTATAAKLCSPADSSRCSAPAPRSSPEFLLSRRDQVLDDFGG